MKLNIEYKLEDHGWAIVIFSYGEMKVERPVSYLHDSLKSLASLALDLVNGRTPSRVAFLDEPGEIQFKVKTNDNVLLFEIIDFEDWQSWGMDSEENGKLLLSGETTSGRVIHQIKNVLWKIHEEIGPKKYKEMWVEHDFPIEVYRELENEYQVNKNG